MLKICYINECPDLIDHATAQKWVAAWQRQVTLDFSPEWNLTAVLHYIGDSKIEQPGPDDALIKIVRLSSVDGALGAHWTEDTRPVGEISIQTSINDGVAPSSVGSHETLETVLDASASDAVQVGNLFLAKEACDRVENSDPDYKIDGVLLENFSLPSAFYGGAGHWDKRRKCTKNEVLPGGYQSQLNVGAVQWEQINGAHVRSSKLTAGPGSRRAFRMIQSGHDPKKLILKST